jgi:hypothetical protein
MPTWVGFFCIFAPLRDVEMLSSSIFLVTLAACGNSWGGPFRSLLAGSAAEQSLVYDNTRE